MSKYIDAEKLTEGIKHLQSKFPVITYEALFHLLDSLQQEQPAKRGYKDCNGCEYNRLLSDQIGWKFRGCFGGDYNGKPIAEIELCPLKVAVQQNRPEVDLDFQVFAKEMDAVFNLPKVVTENTEENPLNWEYSIARHFAEWGADNKAQELRGEVAKVKTKIWQDGFDNGYATATKQPDVDLEKAALHVYESWMGGTMDDVRRDMAELGKVLNARKEEQK